MDFDQILKDFVVFTDDFVVFQKKSDSRCDISPSVTPEARLRVALEGGG